MHALGLLVASTDVSTPGGVLVQLLILLGLVVLSGIFSGSETVLFSLSQHQRDTYRSSRNPFRRMAAHLMERPKRTLMQILVGNTLVNVLLFATTFVLTQKLEPALGWWVTPIGAVFSVVVVLVLGEVVPKVMAVALCERLAPYSAGFLQVTGTVLGPIGQLFDLVLVEPLSRLLFGRATQDGDGARQLSAEELKALLEISRRQGVLNPLEDSYLREVIDLRSIRVADIMVPRMEIEAFDIARPASDLRELMRSTHRTKVPVYEDNIDNVVGLVYAKVVFFERDRPLRDLVTPVRFVPDLIDCEQLLDHFRRTQSQVALVVDEFGGLDGLVTLEDVLEEIVGEIYTPEETPGVPEVRMVSAEEYEVTGSLNVHYWAEAFKIPRLTDRVVTLGGLVAARLNRAPAIGDEIQVGNMQIRVLSMQGRRVDRLGIRLTHEQEELA